MHDGGDGNRAAVDVVAFVVAGGDGAVGAELVAARSTVLRSR